MSKNIPKQSIKSEVLAIFTESSRMLYTQVERVWIHGKIGNMVCFMYKGVEYVYYLSSMDAYWGMVEENDITLNPYLHNDFEMTGTVGRWDPVKKTAVFSDKWLKKQREEEE